MQKKKEAGGVVEALEARQLLAGVPTPDHVVVVVEENSSYNEIIGNSSAPYINSLAQQGALFSNSYAISHPSQPNYLAIFSGSTQGVTDDNGPISFPGPDLRSALAAAGRTFGGYSEDLPSVGSTVLTSGAYARKHNPWSDFTDVPSSENMPFTSFPTNYASLPTVSFVVPNLNNDMHDGTVNQADTWLQNKLGAYATWALSHNSLLIVTWDEDDGSQSNQIPTIFYGQQVKPGTYSEYVDHYGLLRTIEDMYGVSHVGNSASATPITDAWQAMISSDSISATGSGVQITLVQDHDHQHIDWTMGATTGQMSINDPNGLTINSNGGNDTIKLLYTNGNPLPNRLNLSGGFTVTGLQGTNPLAGTTMDIGASIVFINYAGTGDPIGLIKGYLKNGYNGGSWNGAATSTTGSIRSSSAAASPSIHTVGYADWADGTGVNTAANTIELRYTVIGDANLSGTVDLADYTTLVRNFGTGTNWDQGQVTYGSTVGFADYTALVRDFGQSAPAAASAAASSSTAFASSSTTAAAAPAPVTTTNRRSRIRH